MYVITNLLLNFIDAILGKFKSIHFRPIPGTPAARTDSFARSTMPRAGRALDTLPTRPSSGCARMVSATVSVPSMRI